MKAKFFLTVAIVLVSAIAFANGPEGPRMVVVNQNAPGTVKVIYQSEHKGKVKMTIFNAKGEVVFAETRNVAGFIRPVNFNEMSSGEYTIEIADEKGKESQTVVYNASTAVKQAHVARISESGKYLLSVAGQPNDVINVSIFDGARNLVHSENLTINSDLALVYNLKGVQGIPTFEITGKSGSVTTINH